jgi:S1-C subfamily serine protease
MKLIKTFAAIGALLISFAITSFIVGSYTAKYQEQKQDDFINAVVGIKVVEIRDPAGLKGGGTGFVVNTPSGNSLILTNNHVCGLAIDNTVIIDQEYYATIVAHSPEHDLCLISNPLNIKGIEVADTSRDGQNIYIVGHPLLEPKALVKGEISGTMTATILLGYNLPCTGKNETKIESDPESLAAAFGILSACIRAYEAQATTANILPGNSGSPVVNQDGLLIGVAFAGREDGPGRGYIVPLKYVQKFLGDK